MKIFAMRHYKDGRPALFSTKERAEAAAERWRIQGLRDWQGFVKIDEIKVDLGEEPMTSHNHCDHEFKFCSQCDQVYCASCHRDWIRKVVSLPSVTINDPAGTTDVDWGTMTVSSDSGDILVMDSAHSHG